MANVPSNHADEQFALAQSLWQQDEVARAEAILRDLIARNPTREDAAMLLAQLLRSQGRFDAAAAAVFNLCRENSFAPGPSLRGALFLQECDRQSIADKLCAQSIARGDATPALLVVAGNVARELGNFSQARTHYLKALDENADLNNSFVLGALANTLRYTNSAQPDFTRFIEHFQNRHFSDRSRASSGFGLAKAYDDIGDYESAARVLREANALVRTTSSWSAHAWKDFIETRKRDNLAKSDRTHKSDFVPVFIVGLPRTGTTLTATQLAQHTQARDRGELRVLRFIAEKLISGDHLDDTDAIEEAAQLYRKLVRQDDAATTWYIDQDPLNFRYLNIAQAMFPQARIIECRRDRRDTALSLWSQDLAHPDCAFVYDFASIAGFASGYDDLMAFWHKSLTVPLCTIEYEALVAQPESVVAALSDFIGAPQTDVSTTAPTPINSASVWQARQPIYSTSVGRWRAYLPFVPELADFASDVRPRDHLL